MGIQSCPLCSSYGPRDSPELVDHAVRHAYEFALRALPWPRPVPENLDRQMGTYSLPEDDPNAEWFENWLDTLLDSAEELMVSSFDKMDHALQENADDTPGEDYFANNDYFGDQESADSSRNQFAELRSSIIWSETTGRDLSNQSNWDDTMQTELIEAAMHGNVDSVEYLLENDRVSDGDGAIKKRAFIAAIQGGHAAVVKQLLASGIDINSQDENGWTALFFAVERDDKSMSQHLIKSGIDVSIEGIEGQTALHMAIEKGDREIISALFTPRVNRKFEISQGQTPIQWALEKGYSSAAQIFEELQYELTLKRAKEEYNINDRTAAARNIIQGHDWYAITNPLLEPALDFELVGTLQHERIVPCVAFSHDGNFLATGGCGSVLIFDAETRECVCRLITEEEIYTRSICFSPDGRSIAIAFGGVVRVSSQSDL